MEWINAIVQGVLLGGLYALFAAGLSLIFGVMRLVNIAHGDFIVLAAFLALSTTSALGVNPLLTLVIVVPVMAVIGYVLQRGVLNQTLGDDILPPLLVTFGLSVIIPYIGAALVTLPVVAVAFFQWGVSTEFLYVFAVYVVIQALDGNVLVPLLFSEAVNLHPVAIIIAVLFFGGIWGVWGVFFAIPLATLIKAIIDAWPRSGPMAIKNDNANDNP